ncbi:MAG: EAL domain-containing protein [Deltaproteobacteria bacterium]|nr:MAG: EAL domain-containing protein [Deltaproteobacteria bacterium]
MGGDRTGSPSGADYRAYFERSPAPMWVYDVESGRIVDVNAAALDRYGWTRAEALALRAQDVLGGDASCPPARGEHRRSDGTLMTVECTCEVIAQDGGAVRLVSIREVPAEVGQRAQVEQVERNLRRILDALPVGVWLFGADGRPDRGNAAARAIWGTDGAPGEGWEERIEIRRYEDLTPIPPASFASRAAIVEGHSTRGELVDVTTYTGERRTLVVDAVPLEGDGSGPMALVVNQDVTRLLAAERQARQLENVLASSADAAIVVAPDRTIRYANPAAARMLGRSASDPVVGETLPWSLDSGPASDIALSDDAGARVIEARVTDTVWENAPARLVILRDVTDLRRVADSLKLSDRALQTSSNGVMVVSAGEDTVFESVNPAFERLTGFTEAEVVGRGFDLLLGRIPDRGLVSELTAAVKSGREGVHTFQAWRKDGSSLWCELRLAVVRSGAGIITHAIGILTDVSERRSFEQQLAHQASHDALTGLPNRDLALDRLRQGIDLAARLERRVGVIVLDLDEFKVFNDTAGHDFGDALLLEVSRRLRTAVRRGDTVARLGGDEFAVLCPNLGDEAELALAAERLAAALEPAITIGDQSRYVTASLGISAFPNDGDTPEELLRRADIAMYQAKAEGRHTIRRFVPHMNEQLAARFNLDVHLRHALERQEFELFYQPLVDARAGRVCGAEALIRWRHPERGLVPPLQFIPAAEDSGLIVPIGRWALAEAARQNRAWQREGLSTFPVAVNVSIAQFRRTDLVATVAEILAETGLPPRMLELELTESIGIDNAEAFVTTLADLRRLGVGVAIDDFGTGYSSLNYLRRLPVSRVKIDRSFVRDIHVDPGDAGIARSIIAMAHNLGLTVVAEGVETEPQASFLRRNMCDILQGYLYGQPMPAAELEALLERSETLFPVAAGGGERTVLLVDDEPLVSRAIGRILTIAGYDVVVASSGADALELLAIRPVGVVVSDQRMPGMRGTELMRRVKDLHPLTVRIILSGQGDYETIQEAINEGAIYKYLLKPCSEDTLKVSLAEAFQHHDVLRENERLRTNLSGG